MSPGVWVLVIAVCLALGGGALWRHNAGRVRTVTPAPPVDPGAGRTAGVGAAPDGAVAGAEGPGRADVSAALLAAGARPGRPAVVRFTAPWCGRCPVVARRTRVVLDGLADPAAVDDVELDLSAHPDLAAALGVRALPATFLVDAHTVVRHRIFDVPQTSALAAAVAELGAERSD